MSIVLLRVIFENLDLRKLYIYFVTLNVLINAMLRF